MRLVLSAIALLAASATIPAFGEPTLGKGEMLAQIQATGRHFQKADRMEMSCSLTGTGFDKPGALAELEKAKKALAAALKANSIEASAISYPDPAQRNRYFDWEGTAEVVAMDEMGAAKGKAKEKPKPKISYAQSAVVRIASMRQNDDIQNTMKEADCESPSVSRFTIDNLPASLLKAKDDALAESRKEAERYASNLGLKVVRVVRVAEYSPLSALIGADTSQLVVSATAAMTDYNWERGRMVRQFLGLGDDPDMYVSFKTLWVDYILGPQ